MRRDSYSYVRLEGRVEKAPLRDLLVESVTDLDELINERRAARERESSYIKPFGQLTLHNLCSLIPNRFSSHDNRVNIEIEQATALVYRDIGVENERTSYITGEFMLISIGKLIDYGDALRVNPTYRALADRITLRDTGDGVMKSTADTLVYVPASPPATPDAVWLPVIVEHRIAPERRLMVIHG